MAAAFSFGAVGAAQGAVDIGTGNTSPDWAGFAFKAGDGQSFDRVGASWTQPEGAACSSMGLVAFAVGFDGFANKTSEQAGTALECVPTSHAPGAPFGFKHVAFWEMDPGPPHFISPAVFAVNGGDEVTVTITFAGGAYNVRFENHTTGKSFSASATNPGATNSSVEFLAEDPTGGHAPLADFGRVQFRDPELHLVRVEDNNDQGENGHNGQHLGQFDAITMERGGSVLAEPRFPLGITWKHA